jgi:hypothetical protein
MPKASRMHHSDEFGKTGSGSSTAGLDGPVLGAPGMIIVDGITEAESGNMPARPPAPSPASTTTIAIVLGVCLLIAAALVALLLITTHVDWVAFRQAFTPQP